MRMASWNQSVGSGERSLAGLDITDTQAHWMVLGRRGSAWQVQQHQQWPLRPGWVENGQVLEYPDLVDALQQWLAGNQVRELAMALPAEVCNSFVVQAPGRVLRWGRRRWQGARPTTCHCVHKQALADAQGPARGLCMSPRRWQLRKWPATRSCVEG